MRTAGQSTGDRTPGTGREGFAVARTLLSPRFPFSGIYAPNGYCTVDSFFARSNSINPLEILKSKKANTLSEAAYMGNTANHVAKSSFLSEEADDILLKAIDNWYTKLITSVMSARQVSHRSLPAVYFQELANPSPTTIDFFHLCFHGLTNPFSRKPLPCTSIQNPRGGEPQPVKWLPVKISTWTNPARSQSRLTQAQQSFGTLIIENASKHFGIKGNALE